MAISLGGFSGGGGGAVSSVNTQTGAVVLSADDLLADHVASNYTPADNNIDAVSYTHLTLPTIYSV